MISHYAYLVLALEVSGARGEDDPVGVDDNALGIRDIELDFDIRAFRRIVEPARFGRVVPSEMCWLRLTSRI
jgi:hypothetical protein